MRDALIDSLAQPGQATTDRYPAGAIVICVSCGRPLYRLERGIGVGERMGRARDAFVPVSPDDLLALSVRPDVPAGVVAHIRAIPDLRVYVDAIPRPRAGSPALCPHCQQVFVAARTAEVSDTIDRAYVWELHVIPPLPMRGGGRWLRG